MEIRRVFGLNMRRLRLSAGLSQEAAADLIGVGRTHEGAMELGQQNVTLLILAQVAQALGCGWTDLLDVAAARSFATSQTATKRSGRSQKSKSPAR
jgi:transcriptional regulator with XRE-family HTH domain